MLYTKSEEERTWLSRYIEEVTVLFDVANGYGVVPVGETEEQGLVRVKNAKDRIKQFGLDQEEMYPDFSYVLEESGLWLYADECGSPEQVATLVQQFLIAFHPNGCFRFTWARTCSKPRVDEFSGGGCFVTAKSIKWFTPEDWIEKTMKKWVSGKKVRE